MNSSPVLATLDLEEMYTEQKIGYTNFLTDIMRHKQSYFFFQGEVHLV